MSLVVLVIVKWACMDQPTTNIIGHTHFLAHLYWLGQGANGAGLFVGSIWSNSAYRLRSFCFRRGADATPIVIYLVIVQASRIKKKYHPPQNTC